ncbi:hypothetical protein [Amycolatopsis sp. NPDC051903]|uniref:hypothetical protein n=1 Tax=Amycolatopsis sp. NPDC051903 TaxID=3363936 RepID=UPI00379A7E7C
MEQRAADRAPRGAGGREKVKPAPFPARNGKRPFNASGVVAVGERRFVFVDNKDPGSLFELTLDADTDVAVRIRRRRLAGAGGGALGDPEGLARVDRDGEIFFIVASSLSVARGREINDGLLRVRYGAGGDLPAEVMSGFRE